MGADFKPLVCAARSLPLIAGLAASLCGMARGRAPADASAPQAQPAAQANQATILAVEGSVQARENAESPWRTLRAGEALGPGSSLRTGLRSAVRLRIGDGQELIIDRLGVVTFEQMVRDGTKDSTSLGMEYGRVVFDVTSTRFSNDVVVSTPDALLAVKGTKGGIEAAPGFPVRSYGTEDNTGTFEVTYADGVTAEVQSDQTTDSQNPDPASTRNEAARTDTGDQRAREGNEADVVDRAPGGGASDALGPSTGQPPQPPPPPPEEILDPDGDGVIEPPPDDGGGGPPPDDGGGGTPPDDGGGTPPDDSGGGTPPGDGGGMTPIDTGLFGNYFESDPDRGQIIDRELSTLVETDVLSLAGVPGVGPNMSFAEGLAALDLTNGLSFGYYIRGGQLVEGSPAASFAVNDLYEFEILPDGTSLPLRLRTKLNLPNTQGGPAIVTGLAFLVDGVGLYGVQGIPVQPDPTTGTSPILAINPSAASATVVMDLMVRMEGALGADNSRGTLYGLARVPDALSQGPQVTSTEGVLVEMDPTENYLVRAWNNLDERGGQALGTIIGPGADPRLFDNATNLQATGIAVVNGLVHISVQQETPINAGVSTAPHTLVFNPNASGAAGDPNFTRLDVSSSRQISALAERTPAIPAGSVVASLPSPSGPIDTQTINSHFAQLGYSQHVLDSGVARRLFEKHFLETSRSPAGCQATSIFTNELPQRLVENVGTRAGFGRTSFQLRESAMLQSTTGNPHPCTSPMQSP